MCRVSGRDCLVCAKFGVGAHMSGLVGTEDATGPSSARGEGDDGEGAGSPERLLDEPVLRDLIPGSIEFELFDFE